MYQLSVAFLQNKVNHFSPLWNRPISGCTGDTFSEKNKWKNLASAEVKMITGNLYGSHRVVFIRKQTHLFSLTQHITLCR